MLYKAQNRLHKSFCCSLVQVILSKGETAVTAVLVFPFLCWLGAFMPEFNLDKKARLSPGLLYLLRTVSKMSFIAASVSSYSAFVASGIVRYSSSEILLQL